MSLSCCLKLYNMVAFEMRRSACNLLGVQGMDSGIALARFGVAGVPDGTRLKIEQPNNICRQMKSSMLPISSRVLLQ